MNFNKNKYIKLKNKKPYFPKQKKIEQLCCTFQNISLMFRLIKRQLDSHIFFRFNLLQVDVLVEEYEKSLTTQWLEKKAYLNNPYRLWKFFFATAPKLNK